MLKLIYSLYQTDTNQTLIKYMKHVQAKTMCLSHEMSCKWSIYTHCQVFLCCHTNYAEHRFEFNLGKNK